VQLSRHAPPSSVVADASNLVETPLSGLVGVTVNDGVGAVVFDGPVKATVTMRGRLFAVDVPTGDAAIAMRLLVVDAGGAVTVKTARPLLSVVTSVVDSAALDGLDVSEKRCAEMARPVGSTAVNVTTDCDLPSRGRRSGLALTLTATANSDGPVKLGAAWSSNEHPASAPLSASAPATPISRGVKKFFMMLFYEKLPKLICTLPVADTELPAWSCP
jgi:hypothetical protein